MDYYENSHGIFYKEKSYWNFYFRTVNTFGSKSFGDKLECNSTFPVNIEHRLQIKQLTKILTTFPVETLDLYLVTKEIKCLVTYTLHPIHFAFGTLKSERIDKLVGK